MKNIFINLQNIARSFFKKPKRRTDESIPNDANWPEELLYVERKADSNEILFGLNLYSHKKSEIDYSFLCLDTVDVWLDAIKSSEGYSAKQNVAITSVLKGRRLLRAAQLQIFKGYLPEAEILYRSIFELQLVLSYILGDPTDGRIKKYLDFSKKKIWDFRMLCEDLLGKESYEIYANLSQYPHPFNLGRARLVHHGQLERSAMQDYEKSGVLLVMFGNAAVSLCEISNVLFENVPSEWEGKHQEIFDTEIFKKNILNVQTKIETEDELMRTLLEKIEGHTINHQSRK